MSRRFARAGVAAVLVLVAALGAGCSDDGDPDPSPTPSTGPRPLTVEEADLLAGVRANNYRREVVPFEVDVPVDTSLVTLVGRADMRDHLAVAGGTSTQTDGSGSAAYATFAWNLGQMAIVDTDAAPTQDQLAQAAKVPTARWEVHDLASSTQPLDQVARVLLNLAQDRADNAQLLRQNGAEYRGTTVVDGKDVTIMTAASGASQTLTYYVDPETGQLVRVDVDLGASRPATITFLDGDESTLGPVPVIKALGATPSDDTSSDTPS